MFGFMKKHSEKDKERESDREKKKKDKKDKKDKRKEKSLTEEELGRLEEAKKGLFHRPTNRLNGREGSVTPSGSSESIGSDRDPTPEPGNGMTFTTNVKMEISKTRRVRPATHPKPTKGILKGTSNYGPEIPNHGVRGNLDDTMTLEENTLANELLIEQQQREQQELLRRQQEGGGRSRSVKSIITGFESGDSIDVPDDAPSKPNRPQPPQSRPPPPPPHATALPEQAELSVIEDNVQIQPPSPVEKTYTDIDLQLPNIAPPRSLKPREITLRRLPSGDFGFTLRRGTVLERGLGDVERKRTVIFAEPGPKNALTGLLPGDRLIEVAGNNVENASREDIIELIRASGNSVVLKVKPIPELSELSVRSGLEGEDMMMSEQNVKMGTLKRSGSMRYKSRPAKSEDQVASEQAWLSTERVWLVHKGGFAAGRLLKPADGATEQLPEGKSKVKLDHGGEVLEVDEEDVERMNPPQFDRIEDLTSLRYLNESSLLHTLRQRYGSNLIHSYAGRTLLIINPMHPLSIYSEKVIQMFRGCKPEDMPPHAYATAQIAYRNMLNTRRDQSILFMGRSGSGKTTNARHLLHYYTVAAGTANGILTVEKLNAILTLLDAFGNSRTIMNTSATRYTQITSLDFDQTGQIASASIQVLMLEKTRITRRPEGEPTFHVFYQMLAGIDHQLRKELQLENLNEPNLFMTPLQRSEDRQRASQSWAKIHHAMGVLNISESETKAIYCLLAAIYHLGVAGAMKGASNKYQFARPAAAQRAAVCLGSTVEELSRAIFTPSTQIKRSASFRGAQDKSSSPAVEKDNLSGMESLEGFVVGLYSEVFHGLVSLINRQLCSNYRTVASILLVDTPGFQNAMSLGRQTGASLEDLCHNYVQEKLQLLFHETVFTHQQDLYCQENIECDFETVASSPAALVSLIDKAPPQTLVRSPNRDLKSQEQMGLLWLLDEEAIYPGATDESFLARVLKQYAHGADKTEDAESSSRKEDSLLKRGSQGNGFMLNHFQGTNPVQYSIKGWLKTCRENPVSRGVSGFLQNSQREEVTGLFSQLRGPVSSLSSGSVGGMEGSSSLRRASSIRRSYQSGTAGLKRKSLCLQVKFQTDSVIETMRRTRVHFIHCLLPQQSAGLCDLKSSLGIKSAADDIMLNVPLVRPQVRGAELTEAIRIHRQGFPDHMLFAEFRQRYDVLMPQDAKPTGPVVDEKQAAQQLLETLELDAASFRLGLSQAFFRAGTLSQLEDARDDKITGTIVATQALCRGYLARLRLKKLKLQDTAVRCIQKNVKKFMGIRTWSWWRLYTRVQPLLNVHRTEEELKNKDVELEQLKMKFERIEKERNDLKQAVDKLESRLTETSADLAEEHTAAGQAAEVLESESSERIRLERELRDIQNKFSALQRRHEQVEMDLMHTQMLAASMDGDLDEDDVDGGDSIYRDRYERVRREMDFTKKKMQQQHEEEIEQEKVAKQKVERKLTDSVNEAEEQLRQVAALKRKLQRLNQDVGDVNLHLQEQTSRNADLEKKQRKFDSELSKVNEQLRQERQQRDKVMRDRDALATDKFTLEQELKTLKVDHELTAEKAERLDRELMDFSSVGKDDKEALQMKRVKGELERKLADQEEELDEQAGTIQQLEQAKLRLEMSQEKLRQTQTKEVEEKEQELEEMRASTQKKVRMFETQLEEEYSEKQSILKDKRELERRLQSMDEATPVRDKGVERRLRRDLKRTKGLLQDAQLMLQRQKDGAGSRATVKQLRNQLEDAEFATAAAVKARKGVELEVQDLQQQLDDLSRSKQDVEDRCMAVGREKNDAQTRLDENEEDMNEMMKKYKAVVQQQSVDYITIQDQSKQIEELQKENQSLKEQVSTLQSQVEYLSDSSVDKQVTVRLEAKIREVESKLEFEQTSRTRAETQASRVKEQMESAVEERDRLHAEQMKQQEVAKRAQRQLRDLREEHGELQRKETEASLRRHDLEKKVESLESEHEQCQADLRLAFKRIADLQAVIDDEMMSDNSDIESDQYDEDTDDSDLDDSLLVNHRGILPNQTPRTNQALISSVLDGVPESSA